MASKQWGYSTDVDRPKFKQQDFVPYDILKKLNMDSPVYINLGGLPGNLEQFNGIYKFTGAYNGKGCWRFGDSIYRDDEGPYIWWCAKDAAWNLSTFFEEVLQQKGLASGGSVLAMLKGRRAHPALQGNNKWHIAENWSPDAGSSYVYKTNDGVQCSMSWKEHVDQAEARGFNKIIVTNKAGAVCYSNTDVFSLSEAEAASIDGLFTRKSKKTFELSEQLQFFGFETPFQKVSPGDGTKRYPAGSPQALKQAEWVNAETTGLLWSGDLRREKDLNGKKLRIHERVGVLRLNNFYFCVLQNQWTVERAAMELLHLSQKLLEEGW